MAELSPEEFQRKYGTTSTDVIKRIGKPTDANGTRTAAITPGGTKSTVPEPKVPDRETNASQDGVKPTIAGIAAGSINRGLGLAADALGFEDAGDAFRRGGDANEQTVSRLNRNMTAGVLNLPSSVPALAGLAGAGIDYATKGGEFGDHILADGGDKRIQDDIERTTAAFRQMNPAASSEETEAFIDQYISTDAFQKVMNENLRSGLNLGTAIDTWANEVAGTGKMPDEQTSLDDIQQIIGGSLVGLPPSIASKIAGRVAAKIGTRVAENAAVRAATRIGEAVTPITAPLTKNNIAANIVGGTVVNQGIRAVQGAPTLPSDVVEAFVPPLQKDIAASRPEDVPLAAAQIDPAEDDGFDIEADKESTALGASAAIFGLFGIANSRGISKSVRQLAKEPFTRAGLPRTLQQEAKVVAGKSLSEGLGTKTRIKSVIDERAPIYDAIKDAHGQDVLDRMEAFTDMHVGTSGEIAVQNARRHGIFEGIQRRAVPVASLRQLRSAMKPEDYVIWRDGMFAKQALNDRTLQYTSLSDEMQSLNAQIASSKINGSNKSHINGLIRQKDELQTKIDAVYTDDPGARPSLEDWDRNTLQQKIKLFDSNPAAKKLEQMYRAADVNIEYRVNGGTMDAQTGIDLQQRHPSHVFLHEDPGDAQTGIKRIGALWKSARKKADSGAPQTNAAHDKFRDLSVDKDIKVNNPIDPIDALDLEIQRNVRSVQRNRVQQRLIDTLMASPWKDVHIRQESVNGMNSFSDAQLSSPDMLKAGLQKFIDNRDKYHMIRRGGRSEFYSFGDPMLRQALEFAPASQIAGLNALRKGWQAGTTGKFAPWFAPKAALWETQAGMMLRREGRSFGMIDTYGRMLMRESEWANRVLDKTIDPTAYLQVLNAIPRQLAWQAYGALGEKVAKDLTTNSGMFAQLTNVTGGKQFMHKMGTNMVRSFDQSVAGILTRHNLGNGAFLTDPFELATQYDQMIPRVNIPVVREALMGYSALLSSVHNAAKFAFFAQNYDRLARNTPGKRKQNGKVSPAALEKLINETRQLSGDMSRVGGSDTYNKIVSALPYANVTVQSLRYLTQEIARHPGDVVPRIIQGAILPSLIGTYMMSNWDDDAREYWWNTIPTWKRVSTIPMPTPETVMAWANGEEVPFSRDAIVEVSQAPEYIPFAQTAMAAYKAIGLFGAADLVKGNRVPITAMDDLRTGFGTMVNLAMPPAISMGLAVGGQAGSIGDFVAGRGLTRDLRAPTFSGANSDKMNISSDVPRVLNDVIGAIAGAAGQIGVQMYDAFDINQEAGDGFLTAANKALDTGAFEVMSRVPDLPRAGSPLWKSREKLYKYTPEAENVFKTIELLEPVIGQVTVERDRNGRQRMVEKIGTVQFPEIADPMLKKMAMETQATFGRGKWKDLTKELADLNALLTSVDGSKAKFSATQRNSGRNAILRNYQVTQAEQNMIINSWQEKMRNKYGDAFKSAYGIEWSPKSFVEMVKSSARAQPSH